jgi:hypothetical protein
MQFGSSIVPTAPREPTFVGLSALPSITQKRYPLGMAAKELGKCLECLGFLDCVTYLA